MPAMISAEAKLKFLPNFFNLDINQSRKTIFGAGPRACGRDK
jgi:hypothetical protein